MKLYHGSIHEVAQPELKHCRIDTDFGKGFYTTISLEQAQRWAMLRKNRTGVSTAFVSEYDIEDEILTSADYKTHHFNGATLDWLEFVSNNRKGLEQADFDLVMGPVANDRLYATLILYEQGILNAEPAIKQLKTNNLFEQLSFHTEKALSTLKFVQLHEFAD